MFFSIYREKNPSEIFENLVENTRMNFITGCDIAMYSDNYPLKWLLVMSNQGSNVVYLRAIIKKWLKKVFRLGIFLYLKKKASA